MHTFTALYDKREDAEAMQARLEQLGVIDIDGGVDAADTAALEREVAGEDRSFWNAGAGAAPPVEDRHLYEEAVRRGGYLLSVNVDNDRADEVQQLIEGSNAVDWDEREREIRAAGFAAPAPPAPPPAPLAASADEEIIPIVEEQLRVGKRQVERGGVRVRAYMVETPVHDEVRLREERVDVQRRPVSARVADAQSLFRDRDFTLTETAEEAVIGKEARVVEELHVHKDVDERVETVSDTVRRTEVDVDRTDGRDPRPV